MPEIVAENISIIQSDRLEGATRIDAEYYYPKYLKEETKLSRLKNRLQMKQISFIITNGHTPYHHDLINGSIRFLTAENIYDFYIDYANSKRIYKESHIGELSRTILHENDLLITIKGKVGNAAVVYNLKEETNVNQDVARIVLKKHINPFYVSAFINSALGKLQVEQISTGQINPFLALGNLKELQIPFFNKEFELEIESIVKKTLNLLGKSKDFYYQAESLLLEELGIKDINLSHVSCYEVNSANTFTANRIDAEYYQPKYERIIKKIKKHPYKSIGDMFCLAKGIEPGSSVYCEEGTPFIRVSNLNKFQINNNNQQYLSDKTYSELKANYQPLQGEILLSKDATPGIAYHLKEQIEGIISGGILRLQPLYDIKKEYVCLVINSIIGQSQIERDAGGSVISHWKPSQVRHTLIPMLPDKIQNEIESLCLESHDARYQAKRLLEEAKRKVEEMIEKGTQN